MRVCLPILALFTLVQPCSVLLQIVGVPDFSLAKPFPPLLLLLFLPSRLFPLLHKAPFSVTFLPTALQAVMSSAKCVNVYACAFLQMPSCTKTPSVQTLVHMDTHTYKKHPLCGSLLLPSCLRPSPLFPCPIRVSLTQFLFNLQLLSKLKREKGDDEKMMIEEQGGGDKRIKVYCLLSSLCDC